MKKKINIILLLLVSGLWCTVIYKYVNQYFFKPKIALVENQNIIFKETKNFVKDTFVIEPISRDPFLNKTYSEVKSPVPRVNRANFKKVIAKPAEDFKPFPRIVYYGYIKSNDKKEALTFLSIDGKFSKLKVNEIKDDIKVINFNKDSVQIHYNKETRWIVLKKK